MTWYIGLDSMVAVEESEADNEEEAIETARLKLLEWLQSSEKPNIDLYWNVERE